MALSPYLIFQRGDSPIVAAAIHNGHDTRPGVERRLALNEKMRLREEDPVTGEWAQVAKTQIVGVRSRFEVDFNRPRDRAVYQSPSDAWGLDVWREPLDSQVLERSLREYDAFYRNVGDLLAKLTTRHRHVVVYDLHTYNQFRGGENGPAGDPHENPDVNVGTGTMDRRYWSGVVERFMRKMRAFDFHGRRLDVRENVKFRGGHFPRWIHSRFPQQVCVIAIEFRKFFMDEFSGHRNPAAVDSLFRALAATIPGVREELERM